MRCRKNGSESRNFFGLWKMGAVGKRGNLGRGTLLLSAFLVVFTTLIGCSTQAKPAEKAPMPIKLVFNALSGSFLPMWVAQEEGIFQKYGLNSTLEYVAATTAVQAMVSGNYDVGGVGPQVIDADLSGAKLEYITDLVPVFAFHIYVKDPSIKEIKDLRGKSIGVTQAGATTEFAARALIQKAGLKPDDVKIVFLGDIPAVMGGIQKGIVDAGVLSSPTTLQARQNGLHELIDLKTLKIPFVHAAIAANHDFVVKNPEAVKRFILALTEAIAVTKRDNDAGRRAIQKYAKINDQAALDEVLTDFVSTFPDIPRINEASVQAAISFSPNPAAKQSKADDFINNKLIDELKSSGQLDKIKR